MTRELGYMEYDTFKKIADELSLHDSGIRFVRYGEPFLHSRILEMVEYAENKGVPTYISTNGSFIGGKFDEIFNSGLSVIRFSFQGVDREGYELMRNTNKYALVSSNIKKLVKERAKRNIEKPYIILNTTITDEKSTDIEKFKIYWSKIVDKVEIGWTSFARLENVVDRIKYLVPTESVKRTYTPCTEVRTKLSIDWNGDITPCCLDINGELTIGNINSMSLSDAWKSRNLNNLREMVGEKLLLKKIPHCRNCYKTTNKFNDLKKKHRQ